MTQSPLFPFLLHANFSMADHTLVVLSIFLRSFFDVFLVLEIANGTRNDGQWHACMVVQYNTIKGWQKQFELQVGPKDSFNFVVFFLSLFMNDKYMNKIKTRGFYFESAGTYFFKCFS